MCRWLGICRFGDIKGSLEREDKEEIREILERIKEVDNLAVGREAKKKGFYYRSL